VATALEDEPVIIELIQLSQLYEGGRLLAYYETDAHQFLYPYPSYSVTYTTNDREVIMDRAIDFPGIGPKIEFATDTVIRSTSAPIAPDMDDVLYSAPRLAEARKSRPKRRTVRSLSYARPTVSFATRTRSPTRSLEALSLEDQKPPFVVRKVDSKNLIGRIPGEIRPRSPECAHGTYRSPSPRRKGRSYSATPGYSYTDDFLDYTPRSTYGKAYYSGASSEYDSLDDPAPHRVIYRSPDRYTPRFENRYRNLSPTRSDIISSRVDQAIVRNRALEDRSYRDLSPYRSLSPLSYRRKYYDLDSLDELELDLELARRRRYYPYLL
jgi:hypothetical protein